MKFRPAAVITLLVAGIVPLINPSASSAAPLAAYPVICSTPERGLLVNSPRTAEGYRQAEEWLAGPSGQATARDINNEVAGLGAAVLGVSADHNSRRILVILDVGASEAERASAAARLTGLRSSSMLDIRTSCRAGSELAAVIDKLGSAESWQSANATYSFGLDPTTSTVRVVTSSAEHASAIERTYGDLVDVAVTAEISLHSRMSDASPHYGAARIGPGAGICTSNFVYTSNVYGTRFVATAGHCFAPGAAVTSGRLTVGTVTFRSLPNPDAEMLYAAGQTYTNRIYTDPGLPTSRVVVGKVNPGVNEYVCSSGSFTLAKCGAQIINTNDQLCASDGCRTNLTHIFDFDFFCQPGDSGGPWYQRSGSSNALAAGLHIGGWEAYGGKSCLFHKISTVESVLQSILLTTS